MTSWRTPGSSSPTAMGSVMPPPLAPAYRAEPAAPEPARPAARPDPSAAVLAARSGEIFADRMEATIEAHAPGFRELILARRVWTPADVEAANANVVGGDISSGSFAIDQQLLFRPGLAGGAGAPGEGPVPGRRKPATGRRGARRLRRPGRSASPGRPALSRSPGRDDSPRRGHPPGSPAAQPGTNRQAGPMPITLEVARVVGGRTNRATSRPAPPARRVCLDMPAVATQAAALRVCRGGRVDIQPTRQGFKSPHPGGRHHGPARHCHPSQRLPARAEVSRQYLGSRRG